ncbi:MAG: hypothetical protein HBSIN02_25620 [Bacteroidia bacterium]|nr:MAG: hypothetical protein HBSIN02_25620 [Bacteroidia bacterium]
MMKWGKMGIWAGSWHCFKKVAGVGSLMMDRAFNKPGKRKKAVLALSERSSFALIITISLVVIALIGLIHM